jgi:hypothetical protein
MLESDTIDAYVSSKQRRNPINEAAMVSSGAPLSTENSPPSNTIQLPQLVQEVQQAHFDSEIEKDDQKTQNRFE